MPALILYVFLSANPQPDVLIDRFDYIELHNFYDDEGRKIFQQLIFYDFGELEVEKPNGDKVMVLMPIVQAWRLVSNNPKNFNIEVKKGFATIRFKEPIGGVAMRKVQGMFQETHSQYDEENSPHQRNNLGKRRGLVGDPAGK